MPTITAFGPWMRQIKRNLQVSLSAKILKSIHAVSKMSRTSDVINIISKIRNEHSYINIIVMFMSVCVSRSGGGVPVPGGKSSLQRLPGL